ncbi:MAG: CAAD domain-containing protein [Coleofasciculaceae cyanobacterium]
MNPEIVSNYTEEPETRERQIEEAEVMVDDSETKLLPPQDISSEFSSTTNEISSTTLEWQKYGEKFAEFLQNLPNYIGRFFAENKNLLGVLGLIFGSLIAVKLTLAILDAVNDIPLVAPTFQLIGFGYTAWFAYRYLLRASNRQELSKAIKSFKQQVLGAKS